MGYLVALGEEMLHELYIKNLALVDETRVQFGQGLNVLTGETGAGKTVVVGAVNLLLGGRADISLVRKGSGKAEIQGIFSVSPALLKVDERISDLIEDEDQLIIRRIISADGKSKCFVNDHLVTAGTLSEIGRCLVDLHGQHEHQLLFKTALHVDYLDKYGGDKLLKLRSQFHELSGRLKQLEGELDKIKSSEREMLAKKDLLKYQINELEKARLMPGEDVELTKEREILRNAEKLYLSTAKAVSMLSDANDGAPVTELLAKTVQELRMVSGIDSDLEEITDRLDTLLIDIDDCASSLRGYEEKLDFPPGRLQDIEDRLALVNLMKKKYGATIEDILTYRDWAIAELHSCDMAGERIEGLELEIAKVKKALTSIALEQSKSREKVAKEFTKSVEKELADLNMQNAKFQVVFIREQDEDGLPAGEEKLKIFPSGIDKIEFMLSANKGEPLMPLTKVASGGEISRIMLALKIVLADTDEMPSLIFDEIDAGIGGKTARTVGQKMSILAKKRQVLSVTHLPQIASFADRHFSVFKREAGDRTITVVEELLQGNRIKEIARLLSGDTDSNVSLKHAEELIAESKECVGLECE